MSEITRGVIAMPLDLAMGSKLSRAQFHGRAQALLADFEQLSAENEALRACIEDLALSLECEVKARYAGTQKHPAIKPKYDGDMQEVLDARKLLSRGADHD